MRSLDHPPSDLAARIVLLLGAPRSGTTWLGKIFDSHPDVLYRHEPDTLDRGGELPKMVPAAEIPVWSAEARAYLLRLAAQSRLKSGGKLPLFRKSYRSPAAHRLHVAQVALLRLLTAVPGLAAPAAFMPLPDLARRPPARVVIKSVSGCGCAGLFATALPEARIVFVVRPPFGQVASMLEGVRRGLLDAHEAIYGLDTWPDASRYGLSEAILARLPLVEQLAWHWVLLNQKALAELASRPGVRVVPYPALCRDPQREARALFDFAGLDWPEASASFVASSTSFTGRAGYFDVRRNLAQAQSRWQAVLSAEDCARITVIVRQSSLADWLDAPREAAP